jgi:hypothetical protein
MEIIVTSRQTRSSTVLDLAFDLGLDRPRISTVEDWGGKQLYILTFGPPAYRKTIELRPSMNADQVREALIQAKAEEAPKPVMQVVEQITATHEYTAKDWSPNEVETLKAKPQKRKAAKSRK